jgi:galactokinase
MDKNVAINKYRELFKREPEYLFFCPGRVNLIGEHIDYNGGQVLPCAISKGTYLAAGRNIEKQFRFYSLDYPETATLHLQSSYTRSGKKWFNYPLGVVNEMMTRGYNLSGLDMLFSGNLPVGAGLSSSASIEVVTAFAINNIFTLKLDHKDLALLCQKTENEFIGVSCGVMDQFAVTMGKKHKAILLNCDTIAHTYIPFETQDYELVVINTMKERTLSDSKYNERFTECGNALKILKQQVNVNQLCDIDSKTFHRLKAMLNNPVLEKRAFHVISENERVKAAVTALRKGELETFGKLMFASHQSLKEFYEVTGVELDAIVEFCSESDACIGARMTGAGFGGCAIALVYRQMLTDFIQKLTAYYSQKTGLVPGIFSTTADEGVRIIQS